MLQTCTRCRARRSKCDTLLPACTSCAKNDLECTFRDDALQKDIPRSYIKSLNDRVQELTAQLSTHKRRDDSTASTTAHVKPFYTTLPGRGQDLYLDLSTASHFTHIVFEVLSQGKSLSSVHSIPDEEVIIPDISHIDRSSLTPSVIRLLLNRYDRCIRPQYDIVTAEVLAYDGNGFKRLPASFQFDVLMACAIAAAREVYKAPSWKIIAQSCRAWANELMVPIVSATSGGSLAAILLLLIYELADPSRGITWELLDLATRTYLQLGWHRTIQSLPEIQDSLRTGSTAQQHSYSSHEGRIVTVLKDIEGSLRVIFNRPTRLSATTLPTTSDVDTAFQCHAQLLRYLYGSNPAHNSWLCPFVGDGAALMSSLEELETRHRVTCQTWLLFLPICVKHKQCVRCFQEPDEQNTRGMRTLRISVVDAARELITDVHRSVTAKDGFVPPIIASSGAFMAGCTIAVSISKHWTPAHLHTKDLMKCTETLALFAPHWQGGYAYLSIWRTIVDLLDTDQT